MELILDVNPQITAGEWTEIMTKGVPHRIRITRIFGNGSNRFRCVLSNSLDPENRMWNAVLEGRTLKLSEYKV